jgi:hypothetical protein
MKITKYAIAFLVAAGLASGCAKLDEARTLAPGDVVAPELKALPAAIAITPQNMGEAVDFIWSAADFGVRTQINYSLEASVAGGTPLALVTNIATTSTRQLYEALNAKLSLDVAHGGLGLAVETPTQVDFRVSATIGRGFEKFYSKPVAVTVTVTAAERTYPKIWVIGDYCGWNHAASQFLYSFSGDEVNYEAVVDFADKAANGFKLTGAAGWNNGNWGTDGTAAAPEAEAASVKLIDDGGSGNISAYSLRFYRFKFNRSTLTLTRDMGFDQLGIVGDATGSWDVDQVMEFDAATQRFYKDVTLVDGEIKFRLNGKWDVSYGSATPGKLDGGDNIAVSAGNYRVYVNMNNSAEMTYELNAADYGKEGEGPEPQPTRNDWYLEGHTVANPNWGETAMGGGKDIYKLLATEVNANSEFLFRSGDGATWIGPAASLGADPYVVTPGKGFAVSTEKVNGKIEAAGTYDYWFLPRKGEAWVTVAGEKPFYVADTWGLVGTINDWGGAGDMAMTEKDGYLVITGVYLATDSEFKVRFGNAWDDARNYGLEADGVVTPDTATAVITGGGSKNMKVDAEGLYDIYFDLEGSTLHVMTAGKAPAAK